MRCLTGPKLAGTIAAGTIVLVGLARLSGIVGPLGVGLLVALLLSARHQDT